MLGVDIEMNKDAAVEQTRGEKWQHITVGVRTEVQKQVPQELRVTELVSCRPSI